MKQQIECAEIYCLAAQAQRVEGNFARAIYLYEKASEIYSRCNGEMTSSIGLAYMDIANCLSELGDIDSSDLFFAKAREIMRSKFVTSLNV